MCAKGVAKAYSAPNDSPIAKRTRSRRLHGNNPMNRRQPQDSDSIILFEKLGDLIRKVERMSLVVNSIN